LPNSKNPKPPSAAIPILNKAISQIESEDGWALDENNGPMRIRTRPRAGRKPAS
jgi:hypothetical protein